MPFVTWFVLEDGSVVDPSECRRDESGKLHHKRGAVAMRGDVPRSRSVDVSLQRREPQKDMEPEKPLRGYRTRESKAK